MTTSCMSMESSMERYIEAEEEATTTTCAPTITTAVYETTTTVTTTITTTTTIVYACPSGWAYYSADMSCYYININLLTMAAAEAACQSLAPGGHLTSIENQAQNDFIYNYLVSVVGDAPRTTDFDNWIGATAVNPVTGPWSWVDGQPFVYTNWAGGPGLGVAQQPDNNGGDDHCATMILPNIYFPNPGNDGRWNDVNCGLMFRSICQAPLMPVG